MVLRGSVHISHSFLEITKLNFVKRDKKKCPLHKNQSELKRKGQDVTLMTFFFFKLLYNVKKKKKNPLRNHHLIKMSPNRTRKYLG